MQAAQDGYPLAGPTARTLGVRAKIDIAVDADGGVIPGQGGMSVTPGDPLELRRHRRPPEFGGTGKDPLWAVAVRELGPLLRYRPTRSPRSDMASSSQPPRSPSRSSRRRWRRRGIGGGGPIWYSDPDPEGVAIMRTEGRLDAQFDAALHAPQPLLGLRETVRTLLAHGWTHDELLEALETYREQLGTAGRDADEDTVLEAMDFLVGWCSPQMKV